MEKTTTVASTDVPTALPGFEEDDAREKLLLENLSDEPEDAADEVSDDVEEPAAKPHKRLRRVVRTFAAFAVFVLFLVVAVAWFFGMGWFSTPKTDAVNRSGPRNAQSTAPVTEDEKLKMALSMVGPASPASVTPVHPDGSPLPVDITQSGIPAGKGDVDDISPNAGSDQDTNAPIGEKRVIYFAVDRGRFGKQTGTVRRFEIRYHRKGDAKRVGLES